MVVIFTLAVVAFGFVTPLSALQPPSFRQPTADKTDASFIQSEAFRSAHADSQPGDVTVSTVHENFFERMGNAFKGFAAGLILMFFSIPVLWQNEKRNAKYEALISKGQSECRSIDADNCDEANKHWLVHVKGNTTSTKPVDNPQFNVRYESGAIRLSSSVEIYQYQEEEKSETKEKETIGGGKTTETRKWKEYTARWLASYDSGEKFEKDQYKNSKPDGIQPGSNSKTCERVEYGQGFLLADAELSQLSGDSEAKVDKLVCTKNTGMVWKHDAGWYHSGKGDMSAPQIGDVRVHFTVLKDGPVTVVGLQTSTKEKGRGGFLPYRVIRRPACPCMSLSEEEEKERLFEQATRDKQEIVAEDMWQGIMSCCCCACNLVQCCMGGLMRDELQHAVLGAFSKAEAFTQIRSEASVKKWIWRLVGWLMMFLGLYMTFAPFTTSLKILPFGVGSFLSSVGSGIAFVFSFMVTLLVSSLIIALAYTIYHPMYGMMILGAIGAITGGILALINMIDAKSA